MKILFLLIALTASPFVFAQSDTVFIKYKSPRSDSDVYVNDTVTSKTPFGANFLVGTCILKSSRNQIGAYGYGLWFKKVSKTPCQSRPGGAENYNRSNSINQVETTDSSISINTTIYDNCCYDFICDIAVDSVGIINLIPSGYGVNCACNCCFGLQFDFDLLKDEDYGTIKGVIINGDPKTYQKINTK